jgi:hypothetical protein
MGKMKEPLAPLVPSDAPVVIKAPKAAELVAEPVAGSTAA